MRPAPSLDLLLQLPTDDIITLDAQECQKTNLLCTSPSQVAPVFPCWEATTMLTSHLLRSRPAFSSRFY